MLRIMVTARVARYRQLARLVGVRLLYDFEIATERFCEPDLHNNLSGLRNLL